MSKDFERFLSIIHKGIESGAIKTSKPIIDFDLAVQYAIGKIGEVRGYPCDITVEEIANEINKFAPELLD